MQNDKRKGGQAIPSNLHQLLTPEQAKTLTEIKMLGWYLKFVRQPLFQDPVPVVANANGDQIGFLDPDGKINIDTEFRLRADSPEAPAPGTDTANKTEQRHGQAPVPDNLAEVLNDYQLISLHQIETFGWQLHFVRRPPFQDPLVVITNTAGDRFGTLEADGRIEVKSQIDVRAESHGNKAKAAAEPASKK